MDNICDAMVLGHLPQNLDYENGLLLLVFRRSLLGDSVIFINLAKFLKLTNNFENLNIWEMHNLGSSQWKLRPSSK